MNISEHVSNMIFMAFLVMVDGHLFSPLHKGVEWLNIDIQYLMNKVLHWLLSIFRVINFNEITVLTSKNPIIKYMFLGIIHHFVIVWM